MAWISAEAIFGRTIDAHMRSDPPISNRMEGSRWLADDLMI